MLATIDAGTAIGAVHLTVADLQRSLHFYKAIIGLAPLSETTTGASLGVAEQPLLGLHLLPGARASSSYTGLYHFALRIPTRQGLGAALRHLAAVQAPFSGFADHGVSEALYLSDPDGHGIEIYRDRPRSDWYDEQGNFNLVTERLDADGLLAAGEQNAWVGLPAGTDMGHIHLQVADVAAARAFYTGVLGFEHMTDYPGAAFVSAGGYHHHIGLNAWNSRGASPPPADTARLLSYEILLPNAEALANVVDRVRSGGGELTADAAAAGHRLQDPSGNTILLRAA